MGVDWGDYFGTEDPDEIDAIMCDCEYDYCEPFEFEDDDLQDVKNATQEIKNKRYEDGWFYIYKDFCWYDTDTDETSGYWKIWNRKEHTHFWGISRYPDKKLRAPKKSKRVMKAEKRRRKEVKKWLEKKRKNAPFGNLTFRALRAQ